MKFNNENIKGRTIVKIDAICKCRECGEYASYVDYCTGAIYCSEECYDNAMDRMSKWARAK